MLLQLPDHVIVHILLQLTTHSDDHASRRGALAALAFMQTCRRCLQLVESTDALWAAMVRAEIFDPEPSDAANHPARERLRKLRRLSLTGFWSVIGRYAAGDVYTYDMQLCDFPSSRIWPDDEDDGGPQDPLQPLRAHYAMPGLIDALPSTDGEHCDWVVGDVAGPWRMRILAKCTRNMVVFNEVCSDEMPHGRWVNLCSAVISADGTRMEGIWMQTRDGVVIVSPNNSGTFEARRTEVPPAGADHVEWYFKERDARRRQWKGQTEGGLEWEGEVNQAADGEADAEEVELGAAGAGDGAPDDPLGAAVPWA